MDHGVGFLLFEGAVLNVYNEDNPGVKIISYSIKDEEYRKQGDTILTWQDSNHCNFALSFTEKATAQEVLSELCRLQNRNLSDIDNEEADSDSDLTDLHSPRKDSLETILSCLSFPNRTRLVKEVINASLIPKLRGLVQNSPSDDSQTSVLLFHIYKQLCKGYVVHLNNVEITDLLISDDEFPAALGALENDPSLNGVRIGLVQMYEASRFRDVLGLDDSACAFFCFLLQNAWKEILSSYSLSQELRSSLLQKLKTGQDGAIDVLMELCSMARSCPASDRHGLYDALQHDGIIALVEQQARNSGQDRVLEFVGEMYTGIMEVSPGLMKNMLFAPGNSGEAVFQHIAEVIMESKCIGTVQELGLLVRMILDPEHGLFLDRILEIFYGEVAGKFIERIREKDVDEGCEEIMGVFVFCVEKHDRKAVELVVNSGIVEVVMGKIRGNKHFAVYALKFFRAVICKNDSAVDAKIIEKKVLEEIFHVICENQTKEGLLYSIGLNVLESFTRSSGTVLGYVVEKCVPEMKNREQEGVIEKILKAYKKLKQIEET
jgi:hypothetical protein